MYLSIKRRGKFEVKMLMCSDCSLMLFDVVIVCKRGTHNLSNERLLLATSKNCLPIINH